MAVVAGAGADIEGADPGAVAVHAQLQDLALARFGGLADLVDQATGRHLAVHDRRRPLQHLDPVQVPGVDLAAVPGAAGRRCAQAVHGHGAAFAAGAETADAEVVVAVVLAGALQHHAGDVAHGFVEVDRATRVQFLAGDHRDGPGDLGDRGVGLGRAGAVGGDPVGVDLDRVQFGDFTGAIGRGLGLGGASQQQGRQQQGQGGTARVRQRTVGVGHGSLGTGEWMTGCPYEAVGWSASPFFHCWECFSTTFDIRASRKAEQGCAECEPTTTSS